MATQETSLAPPSVPNYASPMPSTAKEMDNRFVTVRKRTKPKLSEKESFKTKTLANKKGKGLCCPIRYEAVVSEGDEDEEHSKSHTSKIPKRDVSIHIPYLNSHHSLHHHLSLSHTSTTLKIYSSAVIYVITV